jgi:hypothetical protein
LEGRTKKKEPYSQVFQTRDADQLKFDIPIFAADTDADNDWVRDPQGIHYQRFLFQLLILPITGNLNRGFTPLFIIKADLSELENKLVEEFDDYSDESYYRLDFEVELVFDSINLEGNVLYNVCTRIPFLYYPTDQCISKKKKIGRPMTFELV